MLMLLIESESITYADLEIEEDVYDEVIGPNNGYPYEWEKKNNPYRMFYFSNYINPDIEGWSEFQLEELSFDFLTSGNFDKKHKEINDFLAYYFKLYDLYKHNNLEREIFDQAISDRLDKLEK